MGNFDDSPTKEDNLDYALDRLEESRFAFAAFVGAFENWLVRSGHIKKEKLEKYYKKSKATSELDPVQE